MSFLLGRTQRQQQQQQQHYSNNNSNSVLYDAGSDDEDELEAAFGDSDARELSTRANYDPRQGNSSEDTQSGQHEHDHSNSVGVPLNPYRPEGHQSHAGDDSINLDDHTEHDNLLQGESSSSSHHHHAQASGSRSHSPRPRMPTIATTSSTSSHTSSNGINPGGYDFEADPYERRSAPIALPLDDDDQPSNQRRTSRGGPGGRLNAASTPGSIASSGFLSTIRSILPERFRQYGMLNQNSHTMSGRRTDGTTDHGDEDDDDDDWIAPPPSMPGIYGGGIANDGVFANMAAKPGNSRGDRTDIVGGDDEAQEKEIPPAYELAVLDAAPPYFDTTVHAPGLGGIGGVAGVGGGLEEILIEGLPLGNPFSFFWSLLVSMSFQFVGFLLTTLLSTSHAAKNGSRAGLGVTLIQYGLYLGTEGEGAFDGPVGDGGDAGGDAGRDEWSLFWGGVGAGDGAPDSTATPTGLVIRALANGAASLARNTTQDQDGWRAPVLLDGGAAISGVASSWLSMVLMIGGWFLLVSSLVSYMKAIRYAKALRDGVSTNTDSWLERGGPIGALYTRVTGQEIPHFQPTERTWGLAPRPAPASSAADSTAPPPPSDSTRPGFLPGLLNRHTTGFRATS